MKRLINFSAALLLLILTSITANAQKAMVTDTFTVAGNCEMCSDRIEAAVDIKGVKNANWDQETKVMRITYDSARVAPGKTCNSIWPVRAMIPFW